MITRRKFVKISSIAGASFTLTSTGWVVNRALAQPLLLDPYSQPKYVNPLPTLSRVTTKSPDKAIKSEIREEKQFLGLYDAKGKKLKTRIWGYKFGDVDTLLTGDKGIFPGATIVAERDTPVSVTWKNKLKEYDLNKLEPWQAHLLPMDKSTHIANPTHRKVGVPTVTHLHGGHTESDSDGLPEAWFTRDFKECGPGFAKETYLYDNSQEAATLWYHDHALGITRLNMYAGLSGLYLLRDDNENYLIADSVLPCDPYEKELIIQDRTFSADGQLFLPAAIAQRTRGYCREVH